MSQQIQQRTLARAVLTQQTVDVILFQRQTEIIEYQVFLTRILETDVTYFYHNALSYLLISSNVIVYHFNSTLQK